MYLGFPGRISIRKFCAGPAGTFRSTGLGGYMHRYLLVALLLVSSAFAQSPTSSDLRTAAGCGPANVKLSVKTDKRQHPNTVPEAGRALLVVVTQYETEARTQTIGYVTTRVGLDGNWIGANHQGSAFTYAIEPGAHRICSDVQSFGPAVKQLSGAVDLVAEAGVTYYYRVVVSELPKMPLSLRVESMQQAEGLLTASSAALSTSGPKK